jgi:hypothetical protein
MADTCPIVRVVQHESPEHILKNLIHPLGLTIGLRMISQAVDQTHPQGSMQLLLGVSNELGTSVRNDGLWHTMQAHDARNIQFSVFLSPVEGVHWNVMSRFGKSIDGHPNGVKLAVSER